MSNYFKSWYEANKSRLSDKRKDLYKNDASYREAIIARGKRYRDQMKEGKPCLERDQVEIDFNGRKIIVFRTSRLCKSVKMPVSSIKYWIEKGYMPKSPLEDENGHSLYSQEMIQVVVEAYRSRGRVRKGCGMLEEISNGWAKALISLK